MTEYLIDRLCDMGMTVNIDNSNNLYGQFGEADSYPCIVAHTDEVHKSKPEDFEVLQHKGTLFGFSNSEKCLVGIGADDKNGIWIALKAAESLIKAKKPVKVAFFPGEEVGCIGSGDAEMDFFKDCRFVLQCDRKGGSDFITKISGVELCSSQFKKDIAPLLKKHGYSETTGLTTDVYELKCRKLGVSVANMSCGYYNPHTDSEMTSIKELKNALSLAKSIMKLKDVYEHTATITRTYFGGYNYNYPYRYNDDWRLDLEENAENKRGLIYW